MTLRKNYVLVLLAPHAEERPTASGLILEHAIRPVVTSGRVWKTGPECNEVREGDFVAFPPSAGAVEWQIGGHTCLFLREQDIWTVIPKADTRQEQTAA